MADVRLLASRVLVPMRMIAWAALSPVPPWRGSVFPLMDELEHAGERTLVSAKALCATIATGSARVSPVHDYADSGSLSAGVQGVQYPRFLCDCNVR